MLSDLVENSRSGPIHYAMSGVRFSHLHKHTHISTDTAVRTISKVAMIPSSPGDEISFDFTC